MFRYHMSIRTLYGAAIGILAAVTSASAQGPPSGPLNGGTLAPSSQPFVFPQSGFVHRHPANAAAGLVGQIEHYNTVKNYLGAINDFNIRVSQAHRELQQEADRTGQVQCQKYRATATFPNWTDAPTSLRLDKVNDGPTIGPATGNFVDARTPEGQRREYQYRYLTQSGIREFCATPTSFRPQQQLLLPMNNPQFPSLLAGPSFATPQLGAGQPYSLLNAPNLLGPSLLGSGFNPIDRYSLTDFSHLSRDAQNWQRSMEARSPWLAGPLPYFPSAGADIAIRDRK